MITKILRNASLGLIFLTVFIPLYVNNSLFFPFITGKAFAFRIIVEILFALWFVLMLRDKRYAPKFSWLSVAITLFVVAVFVADLLGLNALRSLWSNFERMEGWVTIVHLWAYFLAVTSIFGTGSEGRRMWHNFFKVSLVAASFVGIYGFFQLFGWAAIHQGSSRIDASLGNAIYMAVYMLFHVFIAWYMALIAWGKKQAGVHGATRFVWMYGILGLIFAFLLFETSTRGTILGLTGGIMLALGIYSVFGKGQPKLSRGIALGIIVLIISLAAGLVAAKDTSFVKNNETLNRLATISWNENKTQARGYIWPMAIKGIFESPKTAIIGVGQENFNYIFNANYNPKMWGHEQWFDRAHNVYLDWLVAGGLVSLALYLSLFILSLIAIWKKRQEHGLSFSEKCLITGLFVAYAIHNIFVFDNLASYILFFMMIGFVHSIAAGKPIRWFERKDIQSENTVIVRDYIFVPLIVVSFAVTFYFVSIRPIQANTRLITAMVGCSGGTVPSAALYARALELNQTMADQEIREQLFACGGNVIRSGSPESAKVEFYELSMKEIKEQITVTPNDLRAYVIGGTFFNNVGDWKSALPLLEKARELSPNKQTVTFELATNYLNVKKEKEALALLERAYLDAPENPTAAAAYAATLILTGQDAKAQELFKDNQETLNDPRVINIYKHLNQWYKVIDIYKAELAKNPENMQLYGNLIGAYVDSGQPSQAIVLLESMKIKFPLLKDQIDEAIKEVRSGKK